VKATWDVLNKRISAAKGKKSCLVTYDRFLADFKCWIKSDLKPVNIAIFPRPRKHTYTYNRTQGTYKLATLSESLSIQKEKIILFHFCMTKTIIWSGYAVYWDNEVLLLCHTMINVFSVVQLSICSWGGSDIFAL